MSVKIEFNTDNDAFCDFVVETKRILDDIVMRLERGYEGGVISDCNGNAIGRWEADL